jgi:hypothetical protein
MQDLFEQWLGEEIIRANDLALQANAEKRLTESAAFFARGWGLKDALINYRQLRKA